MAPPHPSWVLLRTHVERLQAVPRRNNNEPWSTPAWAAIKCNATRAATANDEDRAIVDAVTLLALVVEPPAVSALAICLRSEQYVFDAFTKQPVAHVVAADDRIVVLDAKFRRRHTNDDPHRLLVYDAMDASLAAVPPLCELVCTPIITPDPLPVRHRDDAGGYVLAIMARHHLYDAKARLEFSQEVLCLWPPPPYSRMFQGSVSPWDMAVTVWALDLATGRWRRDDGGEDLRVASLWEMESFKTAGLPRVQPSLPILMPQKDGGGDVLCFTLEAGDAGPVHLCRLNTRTKALLPPSGLLDEWRPSLLGCDLFKQIEFATTPDNSEDEEIEVLTPKRRRRRRKRKRMKICL